MNDIILESHKSVPITTKVVRSNPVHDRVYSIQYYVIKFVRDLRQVGDFLRVLWFPPPIKLKYCWKVVKHHKPNQTRISYIYISTLYNENCLLNCVFYRRFLGWHAPVSRQNTLGRVKETWSGDWGYWWDDESQTWCCIHATWSRSFYGTRYTWCRRLSRG